MTIRSSVVGKWASSVAFAAPAGKALASFVCTELATWSVSHAPDRPGRRQSELDRAKQAIGRNVATVQGDVSNLNDLDRLALESA
jgi:hypothetical protein